MAAQAARAATASSKGDETANGAGDPTLERVRDALLAAGAGDFSVRLPGRRKGAAGEAERAFNALVERNAQLTAELARMQQLSAGFFASDEGQEGIRAFADKRPARWVPED